MYLIGHLIFYITFNISEQRIGLILYRSINIAYNDYNSKVYQDCDYNPSAGLVPIQWNQPIYGKEEPNFRDFIFPGFLIVLVKS